MLRPCGTETRRPSRSRCCCPRPTKATRRRGASSANGSKSSAWRVIGTFRLSHADAEDALAATLFRLADNLDRVREPAALPGWVATTAKREVYAMFRSRRNVAPVADVPTVGVPDNVELQLLRDDQHAALAAAFARLSKACQDLLRLLTIDPPLSYAEIGEVLGKPHGSIGPERRRCLDRLKTMKELRPFGPGGDA